MEESQILHTLEMSDIVLRPLVQASDFLRVALRATLKKSLAWV
jgi:hypothetical protein